MKNIKKGFTVIEIVIVIAVIAILAGVLIPTFAALARNSRQNSAYQQASAEYLLYRTTKHTEHGTDEELAKHVLIRVDYEGECYFFVAMNNATSVEEEPKLEDTLLFVDPTTKTEICGYSTEKDVTKRNAKNQYNIKSGDISEDLSGQLDNVKMYKLDTIQEPYERVIPDEGDVDGQVGDIIEFGYYPQKDVTSSMGAVLEKYTGIKDEEGNMVLGSDGTPKYLPKFGDETRDIKEGTSRNSYTWYSYKYYDNGEQSNYAWYVDLEYEDGTMYRGVYFVKYRPCYTDKVAQDTNILQGTSGWNYEYQDDNGYFVSTSETHHIYWFEYEKIKWKITAIKDGNYTLMCTNILDAQAFQTQIRDSGTYSGVITSSSGYKPDTPSDDCVAKIKYVGETHDYINNWQASEVKEWLGVPDNSGNWSEGTFAKTAFADKDLARIQNSTLTKNGGWDYFKSCWSTYGFIRSIGMVYSNSDKTGYIGDLDVHRITYTDASKYSRRTDIYSNPGMSNYGAQPLGDKALTNNYIWLPSYQELTGYQYDKYNADGTVNTNFNGASLLYRPQNASVPATDYAAAQGAYRNKGGSYNGYGTYWLRTNSGRNTIRVNFVGWEDTVGYVDKDKNTTTNSNCDDVNAAYLGIRPMTCIKAKLS